MPQLPAPKAMLQGTKSYRKKEKKYATISKYYLQNTHKINIRNAVLGLQIWWHWPVGRRIWMSFSGNRYGFVPLCPWPQLTHLVTSTCPGKMPPWVLGTGWGHTMEQMYPPTPRHPNRLFSWPVSPTVTSANKTQGFFSLRSSEIAYKTACWYNWQNKQTHK